jgi:hypothetical protein
MKAPKTEIYHVIFNSKYRDPQGNPIPYEYTVGQGYDVSNKSIVPVKIITLQGNVIVTFEDGGSHTIPIVSSCAEIFKRTIKTKEEIEAEKTNTDTTE